MAVELRGLLFDDASVIMRGAMIGCPVECLAFAKWWIQRAKGIPFDDPLDSCAFSDSNEDELVLFVEKSRWKHLEKEAGNRFCIQAYTTVENESGFIKFRSAKIKQYPYLLA